MNNIKKNLIKCQNGSQGQRHGVWRQKPNQVLRSGQAIYAGGDGGGGYQINN